MLLIFAILHDGVRTLLAHTTDVNVDIQQWTNDRRQSLKLLGVKTIYYEII